MPNAASPSLTAPCAAALRTGSTDHADWILIVRSAVETGRGELDAARAHLEAASTTRREDHLFGLYDSYLGELPLWERRWTDAEAVITTASLTPVRRRPQRSAPSCAPKGYAPKPSSQRSPASAETTSSCATEPRASGSYSAPPVGRPPRHRRQHQRPPRGSCSPRPNISGPAPRPARGHGRKQPRIGTDSNGRPSRRTAGGKPKRSRNPARPAPTRTLRSEKRTRSPHGSERSRCSTSSSCSQSGQGSISLRPPHRVDQAPSVHDTLGLASREADVLTLLARDTPTARSRANSSSASRRPAST